MPASHSHVASLGFVSVVFMLGKSGIFDLQQVILFLSLNNPDKMVLKRVDDPFCVSSCLQSTDESCTLNLGEFCPTMLE